MDRSRNRLPSAWVRIMPQLLTAEIGNVDASTIVTEWNALLTNVPDVEIRVNDEVVTPDSIEIQEEAQVVYFVLPNPCVADDVLTVAGLAVTNNISGGITLPQVASATLLMTNLANGQSLGVVFDTDTDSYSGTGTITQSGNTVTGEGTNLQGEVAIGDRLVADGIDGLVTGIANTFQTLTLSTSAEVAVGVPFTIEPQTDTPRINSIVTPEGVHIVSSGIARPILRPNVDGHPAITGDDVEDTLTSTETNVADNLDSFAVFVVQKYNDHDMLNPINKADQDTFVGWWMDTHGFDAYVWQDNDNWIGASQTGFEIDDHWHIFEFELLNRTTPHLFVDGDNSGETQSIFGNPDFSNTEPIRIGYYSNVSDMGSQRGMLIYRITDVPNWEAVDRAKVKAWLAVLE